VSTIETLTRAAIRARVGEQSFARGEQYFRDGAIFNGRRQGATLKASCEGSQPSPYRVQATLADGKIAAADCSCPVGSGGYCKHIAALLLTWAARPADFTAVEELDAALERRSKAELVALVKQMLRRAPDLEVLLETPLPVGGKRRTPVSVETYQRQAEMVFRRSDHGWGAEMGMAAELEIIRQMGDDFAAQQDYTSAAAVYQGIGTAIAAHYDETHDEGDISTVMDNCARGLGDCLPHVEDSTVREVVLRALFNVYRFDADYGGIGIGDTIPALIAERASSEERRLVASWVHAVLPEGKDSYGGYTRQMYGAFLLALEGDALDDEAFLRICRETGRVDDLLDRLLKIGRLDEAIAEAWLVDDYPLLGLAEVFVRHGQAAAVERLIEERVLVTQDTRLVDWLRLRFEERGDTAGALPLAERAFRLRPSLPAYQAVRTLARQLGEWDNLRPELLEHLQATQHWYQLIQVHLDEGEIDVALELVGTRDPARGLYLDGSIALQVAAAAEETRPRAALEIYQRRVEGLIAGKTRGNYQEACRHLTRIRAVYERLGEVAAWERYIADLRERHRRLPALKEELANARL
jgi:uncharacterized Zn finger protein